MKKFSYTEGGCRRGETCESLHEKDVKDKEHTEVKDIDKRTENKPEVKEKETQSIYLMIRYMYPEKGSL